MSSYTSYGPMAEHEAKALGYTRHVLADNFALNLSLLVKPDEDLDSSFRAFDTDDRVFVRVSGWCFDIEDVPEPQVGNGPAGWDYVEA